MGPLIIYSVSYYGIDYSYNKWHCKIIPTLQQKQGDRYDETKRNSCQDNTEQHNSAHTTISLDAFWLACNLGLMVHFGHWVRLTPGLACTLANMSFVCPLK